MARYALIPRGLALLGLPVLAIAVGCSTTQPFTSSVGDAGTTSRVGRALTMSDEVARHEIDVDTEQGVVYLRGDVDTMEQKMMAEAIARNVKGVDAVVNNLMIEGQTPPGDAGWDPWITTKVKSRLLADPGVRGVNLDVDTEEGIVYLSGIVANERQRVAAEWHAQQVDGVRKVISQIRLTEEAYPLDRTPLQPGPEIEAQGPQPCPDKPETGQQQ